MGHRSMIYIKTNNPIHLFPAFKTKANIEIFGEEKHTILPFYFHWLYGPSFALAALNVLDAEPAENIFDTVVWFKNNPGGTLTDWITQITKKINTATENGEKLTGRDNYDGEYVGFENPELRHDYRSRHNNDGIAIVAPIEQAYCFMNIAGPFSSSALEKLKPFKPSRATEYTKAYCTEIIKLQAINGLFKEYRILTAAKIAKAFPTVKNQ